MVAENTFCMTDDEPDEQEVEKQSRCADLVMLIMDDIAEAMGSAAALSGVCSALMNFMVANMNTERALSIIERMPEAFRHSEKIYKESRRRAAN